MDNYSTTVEYETKKGNLKTAEFVINARSLDAARNKAVAKVKSNGLRQAKRIIESRAVLMNGQFPQGRVVRHGQNLQQVRKRGFFARIFGR